MLTYYILENGHTVGPFTLSELASYPINPSTMIWLQEQSKWVKASEIEELASLLSASPPLPPAMPQTYLLQAVLLTIFCCFPLGVVGIYYSGQVSELYSRGEIAKAEDFAKKAKYITQLGFWMSLSLILLSTVVSLLIYTYNSLTFRGL